MPVHRLVDLPWMKDKILGQLTEVGIRQHYYSGISTKNRYPHIFNSKLSPSEYILRSTDLNRTLTSAQSHFFGLQGRLDGDILPFKDFLDPRLTLASNYNLKIDFENPGFNTSLPGGIDPFPVHSRLRDHQIDLLIFGNICMANEINVEKNFEAIRQYIDAENTLKDLVEQTKKKLKIDPNWKTNSLFKDCYELGDTVIQDNFNNPNPMIGPNDQIYKKLIACHDLAFFAKYTDLKTDVVETTPFLLQTLAYFDRKVSKLTTYPLKYVLFSTHDVNIAAFLSTIGYYNNYTCLKEHVKNNFTGSSDCPAVPQVASNLLLELALNKGQFFVRILFNGVYLDYCKNGDVQMKYACKIDDFVKITRAKYLFKDLSQFCNFKTTSSSPSVAEIKKAVEKVEKQDLLLLAAGLTALLLIFIIGLQCIMLNIAKSKYAAIRFDISVKQAVEQKKTAEERIFD